jgi:small subunit ribosomal protein S16
MDSRTKRDGRAIEEIGKYHPTAEPSVIEIDMDRANYWLGQGAQPTEAVAAMLKKYADGSIRTAEPKKTKKELYEAAVAAAGGSGLDVKDTPTRKKAAPAKAAAAKAADQPADKPADKAAEKAADKPADEAPVAAETDSGAASAESTDTSDDPAATTADAGKSES